MGSRGDPMVFTVTLSSGVRVVVHPIRHNKQLFLPCTYGYATTIRRAQGATYWHGCIYFNHSYPPDRGYGYVAASRFKTRGGIYLYGKVRRTDWLPVGGNEAYEDTRRGSESDSDADSYAEEAAALRRPRDYYYDSEDEGSEDDWMPDPIELTDEQYDRLCTYPEAYAKDDRVGGLDDL